MKANKVIIIFILFVMVSCFDTRTRTSNENLNNIQRIIQKDLVQTRSDYNIYGDLRSYFEYVFYPNEIPHSLVNVKDSFLDQIKSDSLLSNVRRQSFQESQSKMFSKSGNLIKNVRFYYTENSYIISTDVRMYINNLLTKRISYNTNYDTNKVIEYNYNDKNWLIGIVDSSWDYRSIISYTYLNKEFNITNSLLRKDGSSDRWSFNYDQYGNLKESSPLISSKYDKAGRLVEKIFKSNNQVAKSRYTYDYDIYGNQICKIEYDSSNNIHVIMISSYKANKLLETRKITKNSSEIRVFDKSGYDYNFTTIENSSNVLNSIYSYFDNWGNMYKEILVSRDESGNIKYLCKKTNIDYDSKNNWTKKTMKINDSIIEIMNRELIYY